MVTTVPANITEQTALSGRPMLGGGKEAWKGGEGRGEGRGERRGGEGRFWQFLRLTLVQLEGSVGHGGEDPLPLQDVDVPQTQSQCERSLEKEWRGGRSEGRKGA